MGKSWQQSYLSMDCSTPELILRWVQQLLDLLIFRVHCKVYLASHMYPELAAQLSRQGLRAEVWFCTKWRCLQKIECCPEGGLQLDGVFKINLIKSVDVVGCQILRSLKFDSGKN